MTRYSLEFAFKKLALFVICLHGGFIIWCHSMATELNGWKLIWQDEFNKSYINSEHWAPCQRGNADWKNTMVTDPKVFGIGNGRLRLKALVNRNTQTDPAPFHTGAVTSQGKFSFKYGKIMIRARFDSARGAWPALWMLGDEGQWPSNGEIDLMEHLNSDQFVYQTVHSAYTQEGGKSPQNSTTAPINKDSFNTYGVEWDASKLVFTVNGEKTMTYPRVPEKGETQWPFDQPFYIILSMQVGGNWVGPGASEDYPAEMEIDWIRVYQRN